MDPNPAPTVRLLIAAFAVAVGMWCIWFLTHLPWLGIPEQVSTSALMIYWVAASILALRWTGLTSPGFGALVGLATALIGLLILGSKLAEPPPDGAGAVSGLKPHAAIIAGGFLALGTVVGAVAGSLAGLGGARRLEAGDAGVWLHRFSLVVCAAIFPLLVVGGLVTSTNSGMAVLDWPGTFGSNMFLYPLGPRAAPDVYLEHSHRLFGTLIGLATLVQLALVLTSKSRRTVKVWASVLFVLVVVQGILGAVRVLEGSVLAELDKRWYAVFHGVLGQVIFALSVITAALQSPAYLQGPTAGVPDGAGRLRSFATGALHATIVQLIFGAMYRHTRGLHSLWTHAGFALIVLVLAVLAGVAASRFRERDGRFARAVGLPGAGLLAVVAIQFLLGWAAFMVGGRGLTPETTWQALLRTAHQANGALMLALIAWVAVLGRRVPRGVKAPEAVGAPVGA